MIKPEEQPGTEIKGVGDWQNILVDQPISEDLRGLKRALEATPNSILTVWLGCDEDKLDQLVGYISDQLDIDRQAVLQIDLRQTPVSLSINWQLINMAEQIRHLPGDKAVVLARGFEAWIAVPETQTDYRLSRAAHDYEQIILEDNTYVGKIYDEIGKKVIVITQIGKSLGEKLYEDALGSAGSSQYYTAIIEI